jgi:hypothetical protein
MQITPFQFTSIGTVSKVSRSGQRPERAFLKGGRENGAGNLSALCYPLDDTFKGYRTKSNGSMVLED